MKFLGDENVERRLMLFLRRQGYDIKTIGYDYPKSLRDKDILTIATKEKRILITCDYTDYYDLIFRKGFIHYGVIVLQLHTIVVSVKEKRLLDVINSESERLQRNYIVVTPFEVIIFPVKFS